MAQKYCKYAEVRLETESEKRLTFKNVTVIQSRSQNPSCTTWRNRAAALRSVFFFLVDSASKRINSCLWTQSSNLETGLTQPQSAQKSERPTPCASPLPQSRKTLPVWNEKSRFSYLSLTSVSSLSAQGRPPVCSHGSPEGLQQWGFPLLHKLWEQKRFGAGELCLSYSNTLSFLCGFSYLF